MVQADSGPSRLKNFVRSVRLLSDLIAGDCEEGPTSGELGTVAEVTVFNQSSRPRLVGSFRGFHSMRNAILMAGIFLAMGIWSISELQRGRCAALLNAPTRHPRFGFRHSRNRGSSNVPAATSSWPIPRHERRLSLLSLLSHSLTKVAKCPSC